MGTLIPCLSMRYFDSFLSVSVLWSGLNSVSIHPLMRSSFSDTLRWVPFCLSSVKSSSEKFGFPFGPVMIPVSITAGREVSSVVIVVG